ncbi:MAG: tyrosine--tRNA ligase, partial [Verrucomicrobiota bacterium]
MKNARDINALDILEERGFLYQYTDYELLKKHLAENRITFYVGFDPTADSLHVGHLLPIMAMRFMQDCGHKPLALVGGATAMVGDPSGRTESRPVLTKEDIEKNAGGIEKQLRRFLDFEEEGESRAVSVNNTEWLADLNYIDFLREVGQHFSVNRMLAMESVKQRLENGGLTFLEFNYMLLQAYDFAVLSDKYGCSLQLGGQDQWGNIVMGIDLIRRTRRREVHGATFPLLLKTDGGKFGKTASGTVWLDAERTTPYEYYQFWRNAEDNDVKRLLYLFTLLPQDEVEKLGELEAPALNRAKEILAFEATSLAHGEEAARNAYLAAGSEFGFADPEGKIETSSKIKNIKIDNGLAATVNLSSLIVKHQAKLPVHEISTTKIDSGMGILELFMETGLCGSKGEARRLIRGGGAYMNDERITDENYQVTADDLINDEI